MVRAIGLMSGTSFDGVDAAVIDTDGERIAGFGPTAYRPYTDEERNLLRQALADAVALTDRVSRPGVLREAEELTTRTHAETVERLLADHRIAANDIAVVGFHGQTVIHKPQARLTVQVGDGPGLARRLGIPVVYDFRQNDIAAGGQGAPLVPVFHRAIVATVTRPHPVAVLNIGGVANVTFCDGGPDPIACDTGPGNALIDDFMRLHTGARYDDNGDVAATGKPDPAFIARVLEHPFFDLKPPKSLDRNDFPATPVQGLSPADGAATLVAFTVETVRRSLDHLPGKPKRWLVTGGGRLNPTIMQSLAEALKAPVAPVDAVGWQGDFLEAQCFAFLAVRSLRGLNLSVPTTTGAPKPMTGGVLHRARKAA